MSYIKNLCSKNVFELLPIDCFDLLGGFAMSHFGLSILKNELLLNKRTNILEFGCGLSTLYMGLVAKKFKLDVSITSIESDTFWLDKLNRKLEIHDLKDIIKLVYAPLIPDVERGYGNMWYQKLAIDSALDQNSRFDLFVIDGPPAFKSEIAYSRYSALPFILNRMDKDFTIVLDDANRAGEKQIINWWNERFQISFKTYDSRIALSRKGPFINTVPSFLSKKTGT
ncbi:class I SAM-dependent methyltransferase [Pedobacter sp. HDW13]|uniref:class I SAM-dependent methyltransferase n=1 Tax=unclassified Pedobacter TaxID=2628915 RepID=UPI000F59C7D5|nr:MULTISPECIES: class I SAM-dependent methyltransferase [unclassified Pedobacter]QIL38195.1 class I SAM-dependent methyltransferase [Pedobacter sp. HDW13]RQO64412.1 hypothetical protein DBR40_25660 [Pedobacter sp. KBW01]